MNDLKGGRGKVVPQFIEPTNTPYNTTSAKQIHSQKNASQIPSVSAGPSSYPNNDIATPGTVPSHIYTGKPAPQPIVDLQIYPEQIVQ